ncbi:FAD-dependent oxidoreductase [Paracoccus sp. N5]|uniref:NAD(P)/FAD-dependent oxidoreductase n=1 Tax=Paracoccus sp. N5 TaxID=1101189 RepID=UPI0003A76FE3|nr:FAD-dependent oxidoreductase [Paracoccus sp. N5]
MLDPKPEARLLRRGMADLARPPARRAQVAHSWGGMVDCTPDAIAVIGPVGTHPGLFVSAGHSGHGFGIGPAAGRLVAEPIRASRPRSIQPFWHDRMTDGSDLGEMARAGVVLSWIAGVSLMSGTLAPCRAASIPSPSWPAAPAPTWPS